MLCNRKVLILAPHQDDEVIGCGGIIQRLISEGSELRIVYATQAAESFIRYNNEISAYEPYNTKERINETIRALERLGLTRDNIYFMFNGEYHNNLDTLPRSKVITALEHQIIDFKPNLLLFPAMSTNQDHEIINKSAAAVLRPHFYSGDAIEYEVCNEVDFRPNLFIRLTKEEMMTKMKAMSEFVTQIRGKNNMLSVEYIENRGQHRGYSICFDYVEAFCVKRYQM